MCREGGRQLGTDSNFLMQNEFEYGGSPEWKCLKFVNLVNRIRNEFARGGWINSLLTEGQMFMFIFLYFDVYFTV